MRILQIITLILTLNHSYAQIEWVGHYRCTKGKVDWNLYINKDKTYDLKLIYPEGTEGGPGKWEFDMYKIMLFGEGEDKPHTVYKVKFKGDTQWLKAKKLFGSRIFRQRKFKLEKQK